MKAKMALISDSNSDYECGQEYAISSVSVYVDGIRKFKFYPLKKIFLHTCATCFELPPNVKILFYSSTLSSIGGFWTDISKRSEGEGDQFFIFFFIGTSATKRVARSIIFRLWVASRYFE